MAILTKGGNQSTYGDFVDHKKIAMQFGGF
jgi:hypothetical protein